MPEVRSEVGLLSRFASVGVLNTAVGGAVIFVLDVGLGVPAALANGAGYLAGFSLGWLLHRRYVFRVAGRDLPTTLRYVAAVAVSFAANQAMLHLILTLLGHAAPARSAAQLMAIATYTALQFVLLRVWVFKSAASGPA